MAQNTKKERRLTTGAFKGTVEHKYDYSSVEYDTPAFGWASNSAKIGLWMAKSGTEYMSGGCIKLELNAHLEGNERVRPTLLNVWQGPHCGGTIY